MILCAITAAQGPGQKAEYGEALAVLEKRGWANLVAAVRRFLAGERDEDALCEPLDLGDSMILDAILRGLADPSTLDDLLPADGQEVPAARGSKPPATM